MICLDDKKKTKYEMYWLQNTSQKHETTTAEQGCWGQDIVDTSHSSTQANSTANNACILDILD